MLIICDFDGTATAIEPLQFLAAKFAPAANDEYADLVEHDRGSLHEIIATGLARSTVGPEVLVHEVVRGVPLRPGFRDFCTAMLAAGHRLEVVSAGFHEFIEPIMEAGGVTGVPVVANRIRMTDAGPRIEARELPTCADCGEPCKRADIVRLQREQPAGELTVLLGDGVSDRCAALHQADVVFATGYLLGYLLELGRDVTGFEDFHEVIAPILALEDRVAAPV